MSSEEISSRGDNTFEPPEDMDAAIQRELDEALAGKSLFDMLDNEHAGQNPSDKGVRNGKVTAIHGDDIFIDLGGKGQGILPAKQFDGQLPEINDVIDVVVEEYDPDEGLVSVSLPGAVKDADWDTLEMHQIVEGRVTGHNKGGLELLVNDIRAFMPISQIEMFRVDDLHAYVNQRLQCEVIELDKADRNLLVSRRVLLERQAEKVREQVFERLAEGQTVEGTVKTIMPYGAFVDIGGVDGLLHVRDISRRHITDPSEIVKPGEKIKIMVLKVDHKARRVSLGLKQTMPDPWIDAETKWPVQTVVSGRVVRIVDFGAFVELEEGVDGLVPIGEITYEKRLRHPGEVLHEGQVVRVRIMAVDLERKRIRLSIKQVGDDPWVGASARWPEQTVVDGTVTNVTDFGAFVELVPGVEGLIHISELAPGRVSRVTDVVKEGQTVQVKVLTVDEDQRRISLSIKQVAGAEPAGQAKPGSQERPNNKKRKKLLKGGLD